MLVKWFIRSSPFIYLGLVWLQSEHLDPSSIEARPMLTQVLEMGHLILFAILYVLIYYALKTYGPMTSRKQFIAIVLAFMCALADEIHQYYVPFRSFSFVDLWKDFIGVLLAWYILNLVARAVNLRRTM